MNNESEFDFETTFPPLGHPEHHFNKYPNHPWLYTKPQIKKWILNNVVNDSSIIKNLKLLNDEFTIHDDLTVSIEFNIQIGFSKKSSFEKLPIQFRSINSLSYMNHNLNSLIGTPYVGSDITLSSNKIQSWIGLSPNISGNILLSNNNINSFFNMPNFKYNVFLNLYNNPIKSWDNFTKCDTLYFWGTNSTRKFNENLVFKSPKSINKMHFDQTLDLENIPLLNDWTIDMNLLREKILKMNTIQMKNTIIENLKPSEAIKKRKL